MKDPYAILAVPRDATEAEIRRAYRTAIRSCHPDVSRDDGASARDLNLAYGMLADPARRASLEAGSSPHARADGSGALPIGWIVGLFLLLNAILLAGLLTGGSPFG